MAKAMQPGSELDSHRAGLRHGLLTTHHPGGLQAKARRVVFILTVLKSMTGVGRRPGVDVVTHCCCGGRAGDGERWQIRDNRQSLH